MNAIALDYEPSACARAAPCSIPAGSFGCSKARSKTEKLICASPAFIKADDAMATVYRGVSSGVDPTRRRVGPPPAKQSSPDYNKITVYVHRTFLDAVRVWLFHQGLESSVLFERLLATWLIVKAPHAVEVG
jgi:hypothetical protein